MKARILKVIFLLAVPGAGAFAQNTPAPYAYNVTVTVTAPSGSAGTGLPKTQPTNTRFSPCSLASALDQLTLTVKYDAGKTSENKRDVYVFFHKPDAVGTAKDPKFFSVTKRSTAVPYLITARTDQAALTTNRTIDRYVTAANNLGGAITEVVLGGNTVLEGLPTGTWQAIAIIADSTEVDFDDPGTWLAWDVASFVLGKPWLGKRNTVCL
ncbi:MAG: hypothetical protein KJZ96_06395 [Rhodocyclaceae bacterium]|jgi:hypothetical protein|nr:hypothetical protein [Rhodocyclaceae bacterium]